MNNKQSIHNQQNGNENKPTSNILKQLEDIFYLCKKDDKKLLILDLDDTVFKSTENLIKLIKEDCVDAELASQISIEDIKEWNLKTLIDKLNNFYRVYRPWDEATKENIISYMYTDRFWNTVEFQEGFLELYNSPIIRNNYYILFFTEGSRISFEHKCTKLMDILPEGDFCKHFFFLGITDNLHKDIVWNYINTGVIANDFNDILISSIVVDDKLANLCSTGLNILIKNYRKTDYNNTLNDEVINRENLYIVNNLQEVKDIVEFNLIN